MGQNPSRPSQAWLSCSVSSRCGLEALSKDQGPILTNPAQMPENACKIGWGKGHLIEQGKPAKGRERQAAFGILFRCLMPAPANEQTQNHAKAQRSRALLSYRHKAEVLPRAL